MTFAKLILKLLIAQLNMLCMPLSLRWDTVFPQKKTLLKLIICYMKSSIRQVEWANTFVNYKQVGRLLQS